MLRWRTDSENDNAPGGPVSNPTVCICAREISSANPAERYSFGTKSTALAPTLTLAIVTAFKTLQHGVCSLPLLDGAGRSPWQDIGATEVFVSRAISPPKAQ